MKPVTKAQAEVLQRLKEKSPEPLVLNGRARRTIEALEAQGLVRVTWDMEPRSKGNGMELTERITVRLLNRLP